MSELHENKIMNLIEFVYTAQSHFKQTNKQNVHTHIYTNKSVYTYIKHVPYTVLCIWCMPALSFINQIMRTYFIIVYFSKWHLKWNMPWAFINIHTHFCHTYIQYIHILCTAIGIGLEVVQLFLIKQHRTIQHIILNITIPVSQSASQSIYYAYV